MYMDENDVRRSRERTDGELLHRLLGEERGTPRLGCDGMPRVSGNAHGQSMHASRANDCRYRGGMLTRNDQTSEGDCGCGTEEHKHDSGEIGNTYPCGENGVEERALAMVYAPVQHWRCLYEPHMALKRGTLFRELDMPFHGDLKKGEGGNCRGC